MAKFNTLVDAFPGTSLDGTKWASSSGITVSGGTLRIPLTSGYPWAKTVNDDLTSSSVLIQATNSAWATTFEFYFQAKIDNSNMIGFEVYRSNTLSFTHMIGGTNTPAGSVTYDLTAHKWLRLRESSGVVYWDASPDAVVWTNLASATTTLNFSTCYITIQGGDSANGTSVTLINNFNIPPAAKNGAFFAFF